VKEEQESMSAVLYGHFDQPPIGWKMWSSQSECKESLEDSNIIVC
jgi:hypothetical protein